MKDHHHTPEDHIRQHVSSAIATLTAYVLALSLLEPDLDAIRLLFDKSFHLNKGWGNRLYRIIISALVADRRFQCQAFDVISHLQKLLGHKDVPSQQGRWIASSSRGQVVSPSLFESMELSREPCLQFLCIPAILLAQDKVLGPPLRFVISNTGPLSSTVDHVVIVPTSQIGSLSRFGYMQHEWRSRVDGDCMVVYLAPTVSTGLHARVNP